MKRDLGLGQQVGVAEDLLAGKAGKCFTWCLEPEAHKNVIVSIYML